MVTQSTPVRRNDDVLYAPIDAEQGVMMSIAAGRYYGLNGAASRIVELLVERKTIAEVVERLCAEFDVDPGACETEVLAFARDLIDNGLARAG